MAQDNIPKNQIKSRGTIEQREHEDDAAARRVVPVDQEGDFFGTASNPIHVVTGEASASDPEIFNVEATDADTEYSQVLPDHTSAILIRIRDGEGKLQIAFTSGETASNFITVGYGNNFYVSGVDLVGKTLFFQASKPGKVIEILVWS